jgi:hypothetical protein
LGSNCYRETCVTFGISDDDQYNMDEKGFMKGIGDDVKVLVPVTEEWKLGSAGMTAFLFLGDVL